MGWAAAYLWWGIRLFFVTCHAKPEELVFSFNPHNTFHAWLSQTPHFSAEKTELISQVERSTNMPRSLS